MKFVNYRRENFDENSWYSMKKFQMVSSELMWIKFDVRKFGHVKLNKSHCYN